MKFNIKVIFVGGILYYIAQFIVSFLTGPLIHEGLLIEAYQATTPFWRPELTQIPPDMAALMPRWITTGVITSLIAAGIYDNIRSAFNGCGVVKGLKFGVIMTLIYGSFMGGFSGIFNLPEIIWAWWLAEGLLLYLVGGAVLGWITGKLSPE